MVAGVLPSRPIAVVHSNAFDDRTMPLPARMTARALGFYLRHTGSHPGRWRLEAAAMKRSGALRGHLQPSVIQTTHGFRMIVDGNSQAGRVLYVTGAYEPDVSRELTRLAGPGDLVIDGGAHIGFFTLLASSRVGPTGRVMAFEPSGATAATLRRNVALNGCGNVTIVQAALGDTSGTAVLAQAATAETGQATLRPIDQVASRTAITVAALDDVLIDEAQRVALIKLDLEGAELRALRGMARVLERDRPHLIVEVTQAFLKEAGGSPGELYRLLTAHGYVAHAIEWNGIHRLDSVETFLRHGQQFNALFTAPAGR
jgi:FkbM family methyltransferase